jgi:hypothetical protein
MKAPKDSPPETLEPRSRDADRSQLAILARRATSSRNAAWPARAWTASPSARA